LALTVYSKVLQVVKCVKISEFRVLRFGDGSETAKKSYLKE